MTAGPWYVEPDTAGGASLVTAEGRVVALLGDVEDAHAIVAALAAYTLAILRRCTHEEDD